MVLCANKSDLAPDVETEEEMMPIMMEFKVVITLLNLRVYTKARNRKLTLVLEPVQRRRKMLLRYTVRFESHHGESNSHVYYRLFTCANVR